jgi:hypothetical protein
MFDQQQQIVHATGASIFDQRALQRERIRVRDTPQPAHIEHTHRLPQVTHPTYLACMACLTS